MNDQPIQEELVHTEQIRAEQRAEAARDVQERRVMQAQVVSVVALWFGVLGGPLIWIARLIIAYALVPVVCVQDWPLGMHVVSATSFVVAMAAAIVAGRAVQKLRSERAQRVDGTLAPQGTASVATDLAEIEAINNWTGQRAYFMAHLGVMMSSFFALVILVEWATTLFILPCVVR